MADKDVPRGARITEGAVLTPDERRKLELRTLFDRRTILKWERGEPVSLRTANSLIHAAKLMDLPTPEKVKS